MEMRRLLMSRISARWGEMIRITPVSLRIISIYSTIIRK
jgi:hypothetical protein